MKSFLTIANVRHSIPLAVLLAMQSLVTSSYAATAHEAEHGTEHAMSVGDLLSHLGIFWINFILYLVILGVLLRKAWPKLAGSRRESLQQSIEASQKELQAAEAVFAKSASRKQHLSDESAALERSIDSETAVLRDSQIRTAREAATRLVVQAKERVNIERLALSRWFKRVMLEKAKAQVEQGLSRDSGSELDTKFKSRGVSAVKNLLN